MIGVTGLDDFAIGKGSGVIVLQNRQELVAVAGEIAQHMERMVKPINRDAVLRLELLGEFNEMTSSRCEAQDPRASMANAHTSIAATEP